MERADRCPSCGTSAADWEEDRYAYEAVYSTCQGCMRREIMQDSDTPMSKGTSIRLVPKATAARFAAEAKRKTADGTSGPRRGRK